MLPPDDISVVILCGGRGTRAYPLTVDLPKPLLQIGGRPILLHLMEVFASQGCRRFVLAGGYKVEELSAFAKDLPDAWSVHVEDTGLETNTGGRIHACRDLLGNTFIATYGDGVGDIDIDILLATHRSHGHLATLTTVPLPSQYGVIDIDDEGRVRRFKEKPVLEDHWINAGFFVFEHSAFDVWRGQDLERETLPHLAELEQLFVYRHRGFWKSMDTQKDMSELDELVKAGAPWLR